MKQLTASENKANAVVAYLERLDPNFKTHVSNVNDVITIQGPFPSLIILIGGGEPDGIYISVNSDPVAMVYIVVSLLSEFPDLVNLGAFCEKLSEEPGVVFGKEAYELKEQHIVMQSMQIIKKREILDKTIALPDRKLVIAR